MSRGSPQVEFVCDNCQCTHFGEVECDYEGMTFDLPDGWVNVDDEDLCAHCAHDRLFKGPIERLTFYNHPLTWVDAQAQAQRDAIWRVMFKPDENCLCGLMYWIPKEFT